MSSGPNKGRADFLALGDYNTVCYVCGWKYKASELKKHWQGYYVCEKDWEPRQPQDFVRVPADTQIPPWTQVRPASTFVYVCDLNGGSGLVGWGVVGCAVVGNTTPVYDPSITPGE